MYYTPQNSELLQNAQNFDAIRQFPGLEPPPEPKKKKWKREELTDEDIQKLLDKANKEPPSHEELASSLSYRFSLESGYPLAAADARFWLCNPDTEIWEPLENGEVVAKASTKYCQKGPNCKKLGDYQSITKLLYIILSSQKGAKDFFGEDNPYKGGIGVGTEFLQVSEGGQLLREPLAAHHRCRYPIPASHVSNDMPVRWLGFLYSTFEGPDAQAQVDLLQEIFGATLFGLAAELHQAVLFKGATRAGKGVVSRMLEKLVPASSISAVSPYKWNDLFSTSRMAGRLLNLVGELEYNVRIPAGVFKSFIGGDQIESAEKHLPGFFHCNTATHVFSSNHFPPTTDHGDAFFERWVCLEFPHSVPRDQRIPKLEEEIAMDELPQILGWAIQGARRVTGKPKRRFTLTATHRKLIEQWGRRANPVLAFLHDREAVELVPGAKTNAAQLYVVFKQWCVLQGISKPEGLQTFHDLIDLSGVALYRRHADTSYVEGVKLPGAETLPFSQTN